MSHRQVRLLWRHGHGFESHLTDCKITLGNFTCAYKMRVHLLHRSDSYFDTSHVFKQRRMNVCGTADTCFG